MALSNENKINWHKAEFSVSYGKFNQIKPSERPEIAFSGRSNVGKSSLINKLLNRKSIARVSGTPGKTVTINFFKVDTVDVVDLPGYGYARVSDNEKARWAGLVEGYLRDKRRNICLTCQLLDMRHEPSADDKKMLGFLSESGLPFAIILTKADKLRKTEREKARAMFAEVLPQFVSAFQNIRVIEFSSETGEGAEELRSLIESFCLQSE